PIVEAHHAILEPLRELSRQWLFPSTKSASGHITSPEDLPWSPHAHRHTFSTIAMEAGILEEIVGRLLTTRRCLSPASATPGHLSMRSGRQCRSPATRSRNGCRETEASSS